jgi:hypothetical protein
MSNIIFSVATNELSTLAKFINNNLVSDSYWAETYVPAGTMFFEQNIPTGILTETPQAMFIEKNSTDTHGAFGYRLKTSGIYEIKGVVQGSDYSKIEDIANQIDRLFDWQNQFDSDAGRPVSQQVYADPDDLSGKNKLMIMCLMRNKPIKYSTFSDGVNYCHLGGEYYIEYYKI